MQKTIFLGVFFFMQCLMPARADEQKKFDYCGGNIKFYIPAFFDKRAIEKQSDPYVCKNGFTLKSKAGNKKTNVDIRQADSRVPDPKDFGAEYLAQFKKNYPRRLHYMLTSNTPNGTAIINTFYWLDDHGGLKEINKDVFFGKDNKFFAYATYTANPSDANDVLFMNALEQLFLSAEIDW